MLKLERISVVFFLLVIVCFCAGAQMNPQYSAHVAGKWSGPISRGLFLAQTGVGAYEKLTTSHWERISIDSFTITAFRDTSVLFTFKNLGNLFQKNLQVYLRMIAPGDRVLIFDIFSRDISGKKKVFLQPLQYLIE